MREIDKTLPVHIAVIMDGNGRWAQERHLPRIAGHKAGLEAVRHLVRHALECRIKIVTLFAFSSENWSRPVSEVNGLMRLFITALKKEITELHKNAIKIQFIGNFTRLKPSLLTAMQEAMQLTAQNAQMTLIIAIDYGGRWDIVQATQQLAEQVLQGKLLPRAITEQHIDDTLSTQYLSAPDLLVRTSGEQRISNFLLWQFAYTELYFTPVYWPDFDKAQLLTALAFYANRDRRFGRVTSHDV